MLFLKKRSFFGVLFVLVKEGKSTKFCKHISIVFMDRKKRCFARWNRMYFLARFKHLNPQFSDRKEWNTSWKFIHFQILFLLLHWTLPISRHDLDERWNWRCFQFYSGTRARTTKTFGESYPITLKMGVYNRIWLNRIYLRIKPPAFGLSANLLRLKWT